MTFSGVKTQWSKNRTLCKNQLLDRIVKFMNVVDLLHNCKNQPHLLKNLRAILISGDRHGQNDYTIMNFLIFF